MFFIEAISSYEFGVVRQAQYRSESLECLKTIEAYRRDLDNGKLKLSQWETSFIASAHKSSRYLTGSIKMRSKCSWKTLHWQQRLEKQARFIWELKNFIYFSLSPSQSQILFRNFFLAFFFPQTDLTFQSFSMAKSFVKQSKREMEKKEFNRLFHLLQSSFLFKGIFITIP